MSLEVFYLIGCIITLIVGLLVLKNGENCKIKYPECLLIVIGLSFFSGFGLLFLEDLEKF